MKPGTKFQVSLAFSKNYNRKYKISFRRKRKFQNSSPYIPYQIQSSRFEGEQLVPPENFREQTEEISIKGADNYYTAERNSTRLLSILERGNVRDGRGPRGDFSPFSERSPLCLPLSRIPSFRELTLPPPHRKLSDSAINFARDWGEGRGSAWMSGVYRRR